MERTGTVTQTIATERVRDVASTVLRDAARRGLVAGSRLPTERDLANELQLSRATVRNAMSLLEADGTVSREVGRGTYLRRDPIGESITTDIESITPDAILRQVGPADVMAARQLLEPAAMYLVVAQATETDLDEVERCLIGGENAADYDEFEMWDLSFHRSLIRASHNALLERMYLLIEVARQGELWGTLKRRGDSGERRTQYCGEHRSIAAALHHRDGRGAYQAMTTHLTSVDENLRASAFI